MNETSSAPPERQPTSAAPGGPSVIELFFLLAAGAMIFGSSWLLGARHPWSQWTLLGLGSALFLGGLATWWERSATGRIGGKPWGGWWVMTVFLVGFILYVAIQSGNIAFVPEIRDNDSVLRPVAHTEWLPSSIEGEFAGRVHGMLEAENAARYLLVYGGAALGALGLMLGVQSSSTLGRVLAILLAHGVVSSLVCVLHQASGSTKVLWIEGDPLAFLGAPFFFNKNQNAAYQTLLSAWMLAWSVRARHRHWKTALLVGTAAIAGLVAIRSRAGLIFGAVLLLVWLWKMRGSLIVLFAGKPLRAAVAGVTSLAAIIGALAVSGGGKTVERLGSAEFTLSYLFHGDTYRRLLHEVALEMVRDRPWLGWGGGAYFYAYASYEGRVPEMALNRPGFSYYLLVGHADGDWYEFLVEYGILGTALFLLLWLPHLWLWASSGKWWRGDLLLPGLGVLLLLYHGFLDQTFRNMGVMFLLLATAVLTSKAILLTPSPGGENTGRSLAKTSRPRRVRTEAESSSRRARHSRPE